MSWFKKFFKKKEEVTTVNAEIENKKHDEAKKNSTDVINMDELKADIHSKKKTTKIKK